MEVPSINPWSEEARMLLLRALAASLEAVVVDEDRPKNAFEHDWIAAGVALRRQIEGGLDLESAYRLANGISNGVIRFKLDHGRQDHPARALPDHLYQISTPLTDMRFMAVPTVEEWKDLVRDGHDING